MVQLSTPWVTPNLGMPPPVRRFLSNYFDLLFFLQVGYLGDGNTDRFLPRDVLHKHGLYAVARCLSACLSVCLSVCHATVLCQQGTYHHFFH